MVSIEDTNMVDIVDNNMVDIVDNNILNIDIAEEIGNRLIKLHRCTGGVGVPSKNIWKIICNNFQKCIKWQPQPPNTWCICAMNANKITDHWKFNMSFCVLFKSTFSVFSSFSMYLIVKLCCNFIKYTKPWLEPTIYGVLFLPLLILTTTPCLSYNKLQISIIWQLNDLNSISKQFIKEKIKRSTDKNIYSFQNK